MSFPLAAPRRALLALAAGAPLIRAAHAQSTPREFRIGFQKTGPLLVAKQNRYFERLLEPLGIAVKWAEFTYGPPLLEALNVGSIDLGAVGDAPPIFAQAARAKLLYVAATPTRGTGQAILVPENSPLKSVAELKGKRLGLRPRVVERIAWRWRRWSRPAWPGATSRPVELPPADAGAAFARGNVDAWSIWDPFFALAEIQRNARVLVAGEAVELQSSYVLANRGFTEAHPRLVAQALQVLAKVGEWSLAHRDEVARLSAEATGLPIEATRRAVARGSFDDGAADRRHRRAAAARRRPLPPPRPHPQRRRRARHRLAPAGSLKDIP